MKNKILLSAAALAVVVAGCCENGDGSLTTETRDIDGFDSIYFELSGSVVISQGESFLVTIETDSNLMNDVTTKVENRTLHIDSHGCIDPTSLTVNIRMPALRNVTIDGAGRIVIEDSFENDAMHLSLDGTGDIVAEHPLIAENLSVVIDGTGDIDLAVEVGALDSRIDGTGDLIYSGYAVDHAIEIDGMGDVRAFELETDSTDIRIDGSGKCQVNVQEELNVVISGTGDVLYKGSPAVTQRISGAGSVRDAN